MNKLDFFRHQLEILECLFPTNWFLKPRTDHPAYKRWELCKRMVAQNGILMYPEQDGDLPLITKIVLDTSIFIAISKGSLQNLEFGSLSFYGDNKVLKKIQKRVIIAEQFEDIMVELSFGAWHITKSHLVEPLEVENYPDLKIVLPNATVPLYSECKRIKQDGENNLKLRINKANSQVKSTNEVCFCVAVLDVSSPITILRVTDDSLPNRLNEIVSKVGRILRDKQNRSIGAALLIWDDYMIMGNPPHRILVAYRRRSIPIYHSSKKVRKKIPESLPLFDGFTVTMNMHFEPRR